MSSKILRLSRHRKEEPRAEPLVTSSSGLVTVVGCSKVESIFARSSLHRLAIQEGRIVRWESDPDGGNLLLSPGWRDMVGDRGLGQLLRGEWPAIIHPDDRYDAAMDWLRGCLTGKPYHSIGRCWIYGAYRLTLMSAFPLLYEGQRVARWEGYWQRWEVGKVVNF